MSTREEAVPHQPVPGSHRDPVPGAIRTAEVHPDERVEVTLVLRRGWGGARDAHPSDLAAVERFASEYGLTVVSSHAPSRAVVVSGTAAQMEAAFEVDLGEYESDKVAYRGREGSVHVPEDLADTVVAVLGLDDRPQARSTARFVPHADGGFPPQQIAARYGFPTSGDGSGQTVGVVELGGGFRQPDLATYFSSLGLKTPSVTAVSVAGAVNAPGQGDADVEVALDIEVIGACAQGAAQAVYFGPNTDAGFYRAIAAAVHDATRRPSVVSISWGAPESAWTAQAMTAYDALFADAGAAGVTVYAASGDSGSSDGTSANEVDFPASSPHVVGCGGTTLTNGSEAVWNSGGGASGGGVSQQFALPAYQASVHVPGSGRGVPDVAGDADPATGYEVYVDGQSGAVGGTSAVAPLWSALTAIANQINKSTAGDAHALLYANPGALNDITQGDNGAYQAAVGWDPCTGLGTPKGAQVLQVLAGTGSGGGAPSPTPSPTGTPIPVSVGEQFVITTADGHQIAAQVTGVK